MKYRFFFAGVLSALPFLAGCDPMDLDPGQPEDPPYVSLEEVAQLLSSVALGTPQMEEVRDAASASAGNGYDEEYRMQELFASPGTGVGNSAPTKAGGYARPLRELLREAALSTKADVPGPEAWLDSLSTSDVQIYWPFSEDWDGETLPVITYDPGDGALRNEGYALMPDGTVEKVMVDKQMASERPVWVVNRNSDADYRTLELRRREDPSWGSGGGDIVVKSDAGDFRTLILRSFKANRQYDSWFCGASEFMSLKIIKPWEVTDFSAIGIRERPINRGLEVKVVTSHVDIDSISKV